LHNPADFWGALDNDLKPAVTYTATLAVDLDLFQAAPLVRTTVIELHDLDGARGQRIVEIGGTVLGPAAAADAPRPPVVGAEVSVPALGIAVRSDAAGRYVFPRIPEGTHRVRVDTGRGAVEREVTVPAPTYDLEV
jgi:hypothetical protein